MLPLEKHSLKFFTKNINFEAKNDCVNARYSK